MLEIFAGKGHRLVLHFLLPIVYTFYLVLYITCTNHESYDIFHLFILACMLCETNHLKSQVSTSSNYFTFSNAPLGEANRFSQN